MAHGFSDSRPLNIAVFFVVAFGPACARNPRETPRALEPPLGDPVVGIDLSPDGALVAAVSNPVADAPQRGTLAVWDVRTGEQIGRRLFERGLTSVLFLSPDRIVVGEVGGAVEVVDAASLKTRLRADSGRGTPACLAASADGETLFLGRVNDGIEQRSTASLEEQGGRWPIEDALVPTSIRAVDPERVLVVTWDGAWTIFRVPTEDQPGAVLLGGRLEGVTRGAAVSSDRRAFVSAGPGRAAIVLDPQTGKTQGKVQDPTADVLAADFARRGDWVITGGREGWVRLWDWREAEELDAWRVRGAIGALVVDRARGRWFAGDETGVVHAGHFAALDSGQQAIPEKGPR